MKVLIGYFIRRSVVDVDAVRGKTFAAYAHRLFPDRRGADDALSREKVSGGLDSRFEYDVAEAWMHVEDPEPVDDESRCAVCAWPLGNFLDGACIRGNCSMRPRPEKLYAPERAAREAKGTP